MRKNKSLFINIIKILIPTLLLVTGLILLYLRLAGWSLIVGMPSTIIGIVFLIYSYDDIISN